MEMVFCTNLITKELRPVCFKCLRCFSAKTGNLISHKKVYYGKDCRGCRNERVHNKRRIERNTTKGRRSSNRRNKKSQRPWTQYKKNHCEDCGFIAIHRAQLDVDHVDGNKNNNDISNLKTLCANCHRLKTVIANDSTGHRKYLRIA